jgi:hypothetical protein
MSRSFGLDVVDDLAVDGDGAARDLLEARQHAQERGLAAARRPDQDDELAVLDVEAHAVQDFRGAEGFLDGVE